MRLGLVYVDGASTIKPPLGPPPPQTTPP